MATLITGASAGLGAGFARALAADHQDLILTARRADRLGELATELRAKHGIDVRYFSADLADAAAPEHLIAEIVASGVQIDTLINNAGFGLGGAFADLPLSRQLAQIDVNCRALVALSHAVLPGMLASGRGAILNLASTAAFQPGPGMAIYYATKAFVLSFSEALHEELKPLGIRVAALCPGPTRTEFARVAGTANSKLFDRFAGSPGSVVRDGIAALNANQAVKISGAINQVMASSIRFTPRGVARRIAASLQRNK